jgi:hypothetical protein
MALADPGAPRAPNRKELALLAVFVVCATVGIVTVIVPELTASPESPAQAGGAAP